MSEVRAAQRLVESGEYAAAEQTLRTMLLGEPNDTDALRKTFVRHRGRVAGMFLELVMMNREAILLEDAFVREARALCDRADACLVIDEIQSGFWYPRFSS